MHGIAGSNSSCWKILNAGNCGICQQNKRLCLIFISWAFWISPLRMSPVESRSPYRIGAFEISPGASGRRTSLSRQRDEIKKRIRGPQEEMPSLGYASLEEKFPGFFRPTSRRRICEVRIGQASLSGDWREVNKPDHHFSFLEQRNICPLLETVRKVKPWFCAGSRR